MKDEFPRAKAKHQPCECGCGEMADECMSGHSNPLAAFTVRTYGMCTACGSVEVALNSRTWASRADTAARCARD